MVLIHKQITTLRGEIIVPIIKVKNSENDRIDRQHEKLESYDK